MTAMLIMNIVARIVCLLIAIAFCGASVSNSSKSFNGTVIYGALSAICIFIALVMEVK